MSVSEYSLRWISHFVLNSVNSGVSSCWNICTELWRKWKRQSTEICHDNGSEAELKTKIVQGYAERKLSRLTYWIRQEKKEGKLSYSKSMWDKHSNIQ